jgi:hypothetical protein
MVDRMEWNSIKSMQLAKLIAEAMKTVENR